ncbi:MAG TPA: hypothetical protein VJ689_10610 [Gaiellaceae bacterium]|nr:hypothetical protein [Gaiellaceae bacterium]
MTAFERLRRRLGSRAADAATSPWERIVARGLPPRLDAGGPRVLVATSVGGHPIAPILDGLVASALWLRGAEPAFLLCDGVLPACEQCAYVDFTDPTRFVAEGPQPRLCAPCHGRGRAHLAPLPMPLHRYGAFVDRSAASAAMRRAAGMTVDECFTFECRGLGLGEQARAGTLRFFGKADLSDEPADVVLGVARRYAGGALVAAEVAERVLETLRPDVVTAHHGVYVPQGVLGEVARREGIRVVNWGTSYRDRTFIFSHDNTYHVTFLTEPTALWEDRALTEGEEQALLTFLRLRRRGEGDWLWVTPEAALRRESQRQGEIASALGLDLGRPVVGLLTNVLWDAQLYYAGHAFGDMLEWLYFTIDHFAAHPDVQLVIRVHPHEVKQGNRQPVSPAIRARYPELPANVRVVEHDSPLNTYAVMDLCRAVLVYGTKTGVELAPFGMPVVVAADAWIRGKGLTIDVSSRDEYRRALESLSEIEPLDDRTIVRARRYAYHYFFRRMIPVESLTPNERDLTLSIDSLADLAPGRDSGLDVICRGILEGSEFTFDG